MKINSFPLLIMLAAVLSSCSEVVLTDASESPDLKVVVGEQYEIVGVVDAYGIRDHSEADVEYITLIPRPGFAGSEVGFRIPVELGSTITVDKVMRTNRWFDARIAFIVTLEGTVMPVTAPTRIELGWGNQGGERLQLNPKIYRKLPSDSSTRSR